MNPEAKGVHINPEAEGAKRSRKNMKQSNPSPLITVEKGGGLGFSMLTQNRWSAYTHVAVPHLEYEIIHSYMYMYI